MAEQQLADIADLAVFGSLDPTALQRFTDDQKNQALMSASSDFAGYAAEQFTGPFSAVGNDVKKRVCHMAIYSLFSSRGSNGASNQADFVLVENNRLAIQWCKDVGRGVVIPPGLVDATPDIAEDGADGEDGCPSPWFPDCI